MPWWQLLPYLLLTCLINSAFSNSIKKPIQHHDQRLALVNTSRTLHIISDHFLSIAFDPYMLPDLPWADSSIIKLARELHPAWLKVSPVASKTKGNEFDLSLYQWAALNHFASESGFKQMWDAKLFSQAAHKWKQTGLSANNEVRGVPRKHSFPPPLDQIGFTVTNESISDLINIKELLPAYSSDELTVVGPDIKFFVNYDEAQEFSKWIKKNAEKLSAISWSPSVLMGTKNDTTKSLLTTEHGELFKLEHSVVHGMAEQMGFSNKRLWIGDMRILWQNDSRVDFTGTFGSALLWLDRLGAAAVSGVDVAFQPDLLPMHVRGVRQQPSPEYWVAVLHKRLVGPRVLQVNSQCEGKASCRLYAHCTPGDDSTPYHAGSATMIAINMKSSQLKGNVINLPKKSLMHLYILTGDVKSKKIFLNDDILEIDPQTGDLPTIRPNIISSPKEIILPPYSMAFWVFPEIVASACDNSRKRSKRLVPDTTHLALIFPADDQGQGEKGIDTKPKQKRCHKNNHVPVAPSVLPKILLDTKILADECPAGCYHCNKGPCQIQNMNIVAPGCSTSQLLQRLIDLSKKRKAECCCDEDEEYASTNTVSKNSYDINVGNTNHASKRLQGSENTNIIEYTTKPTTADGYTTTAINKMYANSRVTSDYLSTRNNNGYIQKEYSTENSIQPMKQTYSVPEIYSTLSKIDRETLPALPQQQEIMINGVHKNMYGDTHSTFPNVKQNYQDLSNMQLIRKYDLPVNKQHFTSNNDGLSNHQYQNKLDVKTYPGNPSTPSMVGEYINEKINYDNQKKVHYKPTNQNIPYATTSSESTFNRDTYRSNGKIHANNGYHIPDKSRYDTETPAAQHLTSPKYISDFKPTFNEKVTSQGSSKVSNEAEGHQIPVEVRYDAGAPHIVYTKESPKNDLNAKTSSSLTYIKIPVVGDGYIITEKKNNNEPAALEYRVSPKSDLNELENTNKNTHVPSSVIPTLHTTSSIVPNFNKVANNAENSQTLKDSSESEISGSVYTSSENNHPTIQITGRNAEVSKHQIESPIHNVRINDEITTDFVRENTIESDEDSSSSDSAYQSNNKNDLQHGYAGKKYEKNQNGYEMSNFKTHHNEKDYSHNEMQGRNDENQYSYNNADNEVQGRLLNGHKNLLAPNLYSPYHHHSLYHPHLQYQAQGKPNLYEKLKTSIEMGKQILTPKPDYSANQYSGSPSIYFPHTGYENNNHYSKSNLPLLGMSNYHEKNLIDKYPGNNLSPYKPDLQYPPRPDYYDPYHNYQMNANDKLRPYYENNILGNKFPSIYAQQHSYNLKPPLLSGSVPPSGIFGLRLENDKERDKYDSSPFPINNYNTAEHKESTSEATYTTHKPTLEKVSYDKQYERNHDNENINSDNIHQSPYNPNYKIKHQYPTHTNHLPVLAEECVLRCAGNKICDQNSLYKFVETIFRQLVDKKSHTTDDKIYYSSHSCGESKAERDLNDSDKLIDSLQNILAKGTDSRKIKLGSVYVECPSECQPNSCVDSFSRKIKIILAIISWLKDCINKK